MQSLVDAQRSPRRRPGHPAGEVDGARESAVQRVQHPERRVELRRPPVGDGHQGPHALQGEAALALMERRHYIMLQGYIIHVELIYSYTV